MIKIKTFVDISFPRGLRLISCSRIVWSLQHDTVKSTLLSAPPSLFNQPSASPLILWDEAALAFPSAVQQRDRATVSQNRHTARRVYIGIIAFSVSSFKVAGKEKGSPGSVSFRANSSQTCFLMRRRLEMTLIGMARIVSDRVLITRKCSNLKILSAHALCCSS